MCTSPNLMILSDKLDDNGVPKLEFIGKVAYSRIQQHYKDSSWMQVPCGQCLECRIQEARVWADRVVLESKKYEHNYFVTLTYSDDKIPSDLSLQPKDFSKFIKNLRNTFRDVKIRFFGCGEYGENNGNRILNPHFHFILFNCPLDDLSYTFKEYKDGRLVLHHRPNNNGDLKYSETIHKCWDYKGNISVGDVTYDSAAYVSQYVTKKHKPGMKEFYEKNGLVPEFCRMSTHPGIGYDYFKEREDYLLFDGKMIVPSKGEAHLSTTPRYYDKIFIKTFGEDKFKSIRLQRYEQRMNRRISIESNDINVDSDNFHRDYRIKKKHKIKNQL